jgi:hypothetical protein
MFFEVNQTYLEVGIIKFKLAKVSRIEFDQDLRIGFEGTWKSQFMDLCNLGFIMEQYGCKSNFTEKNWAEVIYIEMKTEIGPLCERISGIYGKVHEWTYVNQVLLLTSINENQIYATNFR